MDLFAITNPANFVSVQVYAKEAVFSAHYNSIFVNETSWQCVAIFDNADSIIQNFSTPIFQKKKNVNFTNFFFLAKLSFYLKTILDGSWFFFKIRCSSFKATTHLVFSLSISANIKHWWRTPGGSIRLVVTRKIHGTSFLLAWMTSLSRTVLTSNSGSRMSNTWLTATPKKRYRQVRNWFSFVHACQYFTFMFKNWYLAFQNCVRCILTSGFVQWIGDILKTKIFRSVS